MTPKEKAIELVEQFIEHTVEWDNVKEVAFDSEFHAKKCALIAVDEIIKSKELRTLFTEKQIDSMEGTSDDRWIYETFMKYWKQVKKEIEKL